MTVVALHRPGGVNGIATAGARLARLPAPVGPWRPVIVGAEVTEEDVRRSALHGAPGLAVCSWPAGFGPVAQVLLVRGFLRDLGATVVIPNDLPHGYAAGALDHHRGLRVAGWIRAEHYDSDELIERCGECADALRCISEPSLARVLRVAARAGLQLPRPAVCSHFMDIRPDPAPPLPAGPLRLLYAGRLERNVKRVMDLAPLADKLASLGVAFHLRVAGDGPARADLAGALAAHVTSGRAELAGAVPRSRIGALIDACDMLLLVSASEGMPNTVMEAFAAGRPAGVTRSCGGALRLVEDGVTGLVVEVGDMGALAGKLASLARDRSGLAAMARAAHARARDRLALSAVLPGYARFIDEARRRPARVDPADPASIASHWSRILAALEAVGPCASDSLRTLAAGWLDELSLFPGVRHVLEPGSPAVPLELPGRPSPAEQLFLGAMDALRRSGVSRVAVYGGGAHTRRIAGTLARFVGPGGEPPRVVAILDDAAGAGGVGVCGLPLLPPHRAHEARVGAVVISSDEHERDMLPKARAFAPGLIVVPLYGSEGEPHAAAASAA